MKKILSLLLILSIGSIDAMWAKKRPAVKTISITPAAVKGITQEFPIEKEEVIEEIEAVEPQPLQEEAIEETEAIEPQPLWIELEEEDEERIAPEIFAPIVHHPTTFRQLVPRNEQTESAKSAKKVLLVPVRKPAPAIAKEPIEPMGPSAQVITQPVRLVPVTRPAPAKPKAILNEAAVKQ